MSIDGIGRRFIRTPNPELRVPEPKITEGEETSGAGSVGAPQDPIELPESLQKLIDNYGNGQATISDVEQVIQDLKLESTKTDRGNKVTYKLVYTDKNNEKHSYIMTINKSKEDMIKEMGLQTSDKEGLDGLYYTEEGGKTVWYQYDEASNSFKPYTLSQEQLASFMGLTETKLEGIYITDNGSEHDEFFKYDAASGTFIPYQLTQEEFRALQGIKDPIDNAYTALSAENVQLHFYQFVLDVMNNDGQDLDGDGMDDDTNAYNLFSGRQIDTFVDSIITKVLQEESQKESPNYNINYLIGRVEDEILNALVVNPIAPEDIEHNIMNTDDRLLSPEELAMKHDMEKIGLDTDPEKIDPLEEIDYSVLADTDALSVLISNDQILADFLEGVFNDLDWAVDCLVVRDNKLVFDENSFAGIIYQQLDKLEEQLLTLIKDKLGDKYNEENAKKYLHYFMTETVREVCQSVLVSLADLMPATYGYYKDMYPNTILNGDLSMESIAQLFTTLVKNELAKENPFDTSMESDSVDSLLLATSDYFLTEEERAKKGEMNVTRYEGPTAPGEQNANMIDTVLSKNNDDIQKYYQEKVGDETATIDNKTLKDLLHSESSPLYGKEGPFTEEEIMAAVYAVIDKQVEEQNTREFKDVSHSSVTNGAYETANDYADGAHKYIEDYLSKQNVKNALTKYYEALLEANGVKNDGEFNYDAIVKSAVHGDFSTTTKFSDVQLLESAMKAIRKAVINKAEEQGIILKSDEFETNGTDGTNGKDGVDGKDPESPEDPDSADENKQTSDTAKAALEALNANENDPLAKSCEDEIFLLEARNNSEPLVFDYTVDSNGNKKFKDSKVQGLYDSLFAQIKATIGDKGFDEATMKKLFDAAWDIVYTHRAPGEEQDISNFLEDVYSNFRGILDKISENPAYLDIFTGTTATGTNGVYDATQNENSKDLVDCRGGAIEYNDGTIHVQDDESDAKLQQAVKKMIEDLKKAYPDIPEDRLTTIVQSAVKRAIDNISTGNSSDIPSNFTYNTVTNPIFDYIIEANATVGTIVNLALHYVERQLYSAATHDTNGALISGNDKADEPAGTKGTPTTDPIISEDTAGTIADVLKYQYDEGDIHLYLDRNDMDTHWLDMTVDSNGNIQFADRKTEQAYKDLFAKMLKALRDEGIKSTDLSDAEFKKMYQAAWISAYNNFDNNQRYKLQDVLEVVVANLKTIVSKSSSSKDSVAQSVIEAGSAMSVVEPNNRVLDYHGDPSLDYGDGNVHLSNNDSDQIYQAEIEKLRTKLKAKFPGIPEKTIDEWLSQAQKDAIKECQGNGNDLPGGSREGDEYRITVEDLMRAIAYKFDKIMYSNLFS